MGVAGRMPAPEEAKEEAVGDVADVPAPEEAGVPAPEEAKEEDVEEVKQAKMDEEINIEEYKGE